MGVPPSRYIFRFGRDPAQLSRVHHDDALKKSSSGIYLDKEACTPLRAQERAAPGGRKEKLTWIV